MTNIVAVIPFIHAPYAEELNDTLKLPTDKVLWVDNRKDNRGVAGSWNIGIDFMKEQNAEWLIIISAAMRFGEAGGLDMFEQIEKLNQSAVIRFAQKDTPGQTFDGDNKANNPPYPEVFYWHCTAISSEVVNAVGKFDANFYPIYFEDVDYDLRLQKAGFKADVIAPIDAVSISAGHAAKLANIESPSAPLITYFAEKWGRHPAAAILGCYDRPFNNNENSLAFWPPAHGGIWNE